MDWSKLELEMMKREQDILHIQNKLKEGCCVFKNDQLEQEAFLHKSSKKLGVTQFTYFDKHGAVGDFVAKTVNDIATKIYDYGFTPCHEDELNNSMMAKKQPPKITKKKQPNIELER